MCWREDVTGYGKAGLLLIKLVRPRERLTLRLATKFLLVYSFIGQNKKPTGSLHQIGVIPPHHSHKKPPLSIVLATR